MAERQRRVLSAAECGAHRDLRGALWGIMRSLARVANEIPAATVQVDSRFGHEIPATESEAKRVKAFARQKKQD